MTKLKEQNERLDAISHELCVYSPSDDNIASHLARSSSARGKPRFSLDLATCFALLPLSGESL